MSFTEKVEILVVNPIHNGDLHKRSPFFIWEIAPPWRGTWFGTRGLHDLPLSGMFTQRRKKATMKIGCFFRFWGFQAIILTVWHRISGMQ